MAIKYLSFFIFGKQVMLLIIAFFYAEICFADKSPFELVYIAPISYLLAAQSRKVVHHLSIFLHGNYNSVIAASIDAIIICSMVLWYW